MKLETHATPGQVGHVKEFGSILRVRENHCRVSCGGGTIRSIFWEEYSLLCREWSGGAPIRENWVRGKIGRVYMLN